MPDFAMLKFGDERLPERYWSKVKPDSETDCWNWIGCCDKKGYGRYTVSADRTGLSAYRVSLETMIGTIEPNLDVDHLCRNPACVNPQHLEPVTRRENLLRGRTLAARNASAVKCIHGHRFDELNTYITPNGRRNCRTCRAAANRACEARRKAVGSVA